MSKFLVFGKVLTALFWGVVLANLLQPFAQPFALLLHAIAGLIALIHGLELWLFNSRLANCEKPWQHQAQVLLFGIFHLLALPQGQSSVEAGEPSQDGAQLEVENA